MVNRMRNRCCSSLFYIVAALFVFAFSLTLAFPSAADNGVDIVGIYNEAMSGLYPEASAVKEAGPSAGTGTQSSAAPASVYRPSHSGNFEDDEIPVDEDEEEDDVWDEEVSAEEASPGTGYDTGDGGSANGKQQSGNLSAKQEIEMSLQTLRGVRSDPREMMGQLTAGENEMQVPTANLYMVVKTLSVFGMAITFFRAAVLIMRDGARGRKEAVNILTEKGLLLIVIFGFSFFANIVVTIAEKI